MNLLPNVQNGLAETRGGTELREASPVASKCAVEESWNQELFWEILNAGTSLLEWVSSASPNTLNLNQFFLVGEREEYYSS